ncbi:MAG: hypothetical protein LUG91_00690, partial [Ruminococcus sp.]|nr:hypothetical protein [Ruminococcus sp.]
TSTDNSDSRSYDYDYSQAFEKSVNDILNEYSSTYDSSKQIFYDYSRETNESMGDVIDQYDYSQDNSSVVAEPDTDRTVEREFFVSAGNDEIRKDSDSENSSGDKKITLEIEGKGNIQLQGGKADEETMLAFLYEYLKPVLSEILRQEVYEEGDFSYGY